MIKLHPEILHHQGKPQFAVLPYGEFLAVQDELEDAACLRILRKAKSAEGKSETLSLKEMKSRLASSNARRSTKKVKSKSPAA